MEMKPHKSFVLCPACGACPTIDVYQEEVRIGEPGEQVKLTKDQWNALVEKIRGGELTAL